MPFGPAEQQFVVMQISLGKPVTENEKDWAIRHGYAAIEDGELKPTEAGWTFFQGR